MTRHQRRKLARKRKDDRAELLNSRALRLLQSEKERLNLSKPKRGERTPRGLTSSIYSGAANPMGFTRPLTWTKGAAK
jgi:hypothetical protein